MQATDSKQFVDDKSFATQLRADVIAMVHSGGDGHIGASLSIAEMVACLYGGIMNVDPDNPRWDDRDRLILSKGHSCPIVYAALARRGFFPLSELRSLRRLNSILQGHPDTVKTPGIDSTAGPLGHGISVGSGMALAGRLQQRDYYVYVITGDGELEEGIVWEGMMAAQKYALGKLIVFIDNNGYQSGGRIEDVSGLSPIFPKFQAFGWHCQEIDGHDTEQIRHAVKNAKAATDRPSCILAHTVKVKGVSFMEGDNSWHKRVPTSEEATRAFAELGGAPEWLI